VTRALFDIGKARRIIKEGAKAYFTRLRAKFPDEVFYVYVAVGSDDDARLVHFTANSLSGYEKDAAKYLADEEEVKSHKEQGFHHQVLYYKWGFPEWGWYQGGETDVDAFYDLIDAAEDEDEDLDPSVPPGLEVNVNLRSQSYAATVLGLRDLDVEGFFDTGLEREKVTLYFTLIDSEEANWLAIESARLLNPPTVFERFFADWCLAMTSEKELAKERDHPSSVHKAFAALIADHS
jgi:hypothetical protein